MRRLLAVSGVPALAAALVALPSLVSAAPAPAGAVTVPVATGTGGAVASMDTDASQAGITALKQGGNAIDAAVATASALGVTIPFVAGPGGGGFMVIYLAKTHQVVTINGRETCPAACTPTMFTDPKTGQPLGYDYASDQPLATGVPSMVATWAQAVSRYGNKSLGADLQPAIGVAERGFRVTRTSSSSPSPTCRNCRLTRPAAPCCSPRRASRCPWVTCSATPTWPGPTGCWPATARRTSMTAPWAGPSFRLMIIPL
jgi:gamma-glutamyltranspeptidase/glutathione hydrolase